jgi:hypothetical protein
MNLIARLRDGIGVEQAATVLTQTFDALAW